MKTDSSFYVLQGTVEKLKLGNIEIARDWGWAPEYVEAMWMILQQEKVDDFVIAAGETNRLEDFVSEVFRCVWLDWRNHVETDSSLLRPSEIMVSRANPEKSALILGWQATNRMKDVARMMVEEFLQ